MKQEENIAFIGGGNITRSILAGLIRAGKSPDEIWVSDPGQEKLDSIHSDFSIQTTTDNIEAVNHANIIVLAVKPNIISKVAEELASVIQQRKIVVLSVAAGVRSSDFKKILGADCQVIRAMPNVAAFVGSAATGLYADPNVSEDARNSAEEIMRSVGVTVWVDAEPLMDTVTALSGSGPAYFFLFMKILTEAAEQQGLDPKTARLLTIQTVLGAAHVALESETDLQTLISSVTSPGGTTEKALESLHENNIQSTLTNALHAAHARAKELADQFAGDK